MTKNEGPKHLVMVSREFVIAQLRRFHTLLLIRALLLPLLLIFLAPFLVFLDLDAEKPPIKFFESAAT